MKIKKKILLIASCIMATVLMAASLTACGGSSGYAGAKSEEGYYAETTAAGYYVNDSAYYDGGAEMEAAETVSESSQRSTKIIYTATIEMQSTEFDTALSDIDSQVAAVEGAYYENRSVYSGNRNYRSASMTIRVPVKQLDSFVEAIKGAATVTSEFQNAEDVSDYYYDTETRLETAKTKLARLQELLAKAEDMEDIITIESAISDTEYDIDALQGTLKYYDSKVEYSTVSITLSEVTKVDNMETPVTFSERLSASFKNGVESFVDGLGDFLIWLAGAWPVLLIVIGIPAIVLIIILSSVKRKRKKARMQKETEAKTKAEEQTEEDKK